MLIYGGVVKYGGSFPKVHHPHHKEATLYRPTTLHISAFKNTFTHHQRLETQWWKLDRTQSASLGGQSSPPGGQSAYLAGKARTLIARNLVGKARTMVAKAYLGGQSLGGQSSYLGSQSSYQRPKLVLWWPIALPKLFKLI